MIGECNFRCWRRCAMVTLIRVILHKWSNWVVFCKFLLEVVRLKGECDVSLTALPNRDWRVFRQHAAPPLDNLCILVGPHACAWGLCYSYHFIPISAVLVDITLIYFSFGIPINIILSVGNQQLWKLHPANPNYVQLTPTKVRPLPSGGATRKLRVVPLDYLIISIDTLECIGATGAIRVNLHFRIFCE